MLFWLRKGPDKRKREFMLLETKRNYRHNCTELITSLGEVCSFFGIGGQL